MTESNASISPAMRARLQKCFEYGNQKMQLGDYDYATEMFVQCVCGDPSNILYMNSFIANLRMKFGNQKKKSAFGFLSKAKSNLPTVGKDKDLETTIKDGCARLRKDPWDAQAFVSMGLACLAAEYVDPGLAYLKHAIESSPDDLEINRLAARELTDRKIIDQALFCWNRVLKIKPDDQEAGKQISDLMLEQTINRVSGTKRGSKEEDEDNENGGPVEKLTVEDECEKRLRKNPNDRDAFVDLIDYFFQKGNLRKTEDACKRALKVFPNDDIFFPKLLETQKARALEELGLIKSKYEKSPSEDLKKKFLDQKQKYEEVALQLIQYELKKSPSSTKLHFEYGSLLTQLGKHREAIGEYQLAKSDATLAGNCLLALAQAFQRIKQYRLAATHYDQAVARLEQDAPQSEELKQALYFGARLAFGLNDFKKADDFANKLAAVDFSYKDVGGLLDKIAEKLHN